MKRNILFFIKFFTEEIYADQFVAGELYLNTLSFFKRIEKEGSDGRFDSTEAVATWWQPDDILIKLNAPGIGSAEISRKDLAAPVSTSIGAQDYVHVFCLYAVHMTGFELLENGKVKFFEKGADELRQQLRIDERCFKFGKFAVVISAVPFIKKLREALTSQGHKFKDKLVRYYDDTVFHGTIPTSEVPFRKQKRFSYQQEYRVCVYPTVMHDSPITIKIGNISSMCSKVVSSQQLSNFLTVTEPASM
jgi:hypothetical protein